MSKHLTNSSIHRQNILNNPYALQEIEKVTVMLKAQVAAFFEVILRTVENYLNQYGEEPVKSIMGSLYYLVKVSLQKAEINDIRWLQDYS